jgi:hypothetical protein
MEGQRPGALERVEAGTQGGLEFMYVWRYGGRVGIEPQRSRGLEGVQVCRSGGMEVGRSWRSWRSWRSGGLEVMQAWSREVLRLGVIEVVEVWR